MLAVARYSRMRSSLDDVLSHTRVRDESDVRLPSSEKLSRVCINLRDNYGALGYDPEEDDLRWSGFVLLRQPIKYRIERSTR